jgi:hypothetical protein
MKYDTLMYLFGLKVLPRVLLDLIHFQPSLFEIKYISEKNVLNTFVTIP